MISPSSSHQSFERSQPQRFYGELHRVCLNRHLRYPSTARASIQFSVRSELYDRDFASETIGQLIVHIIPAKLLHEAGNRGLGIDQQAFDARHVRKILQVLGP
jgi:hypothetical protein